jgi:hypothetical protein
MRNAEVVEPGPAKTFWIQFVQERVWNTTGSRSELKEAFK